MKETSSDSLEKIGAIAYNREYYERVNRCPAVVFVGEERVPRCDAYGSGGPFLELPRPCTYRESKECPVNRYSYTCEELIMELEDWLSNKEMLNNV